MLCITQAVQPDVQRPLQQLHARLFVALGPILQVHSQGLQLPCGLLVGLQTAAKLRLFGLLQRHAQVGRRGLGIAGCLADVCGAGQQALAQLNCGGLAIRRQQRLDHAIGLTPSGLERALPVGVHGGRSAGQLDQRAHGVDPLLLGGGSGQLSGLAQVGQAALGVRRRRGCLSQQRQGAHGLIGAQVANEQVDQGGIRRLARGVDHGQRLHGVGLVARGVSEGLLGESAGAVVGCLEGGAAAGQGPPQGDGGGAVGGALRFGLQQLPQGRCDAGGASVDLGHAIEIGGVLGLRGLGQLRRDQLEGLDRLVEALVMQIGEQHPGQSLDLRIGGVGDGVLVVGDLASEAILSRDLVEHRPAQAVGVLIVGILGQDRVKQIGGGHMLAAPDGALRRRHEDGMARPWIGQLGGCRLEQGLALGVLSGGLAEAQHGLHGLFIGRVGGDDLLELGQCGVGIGQLGLEDGGELGALLAQTHPGGEPVHALKAGRDGLRVGALGLPAGDLLIQRDACHLVIVLGSEVSEGRVEGGILQTCLDHTIQQREPVLGAACGLGLQMSQGRREARFGLLGVRGVDFTPTAFEVG